MKKKYLNINASGILDICNILFKMTKNECNWTNAKKGYNKCSVLCR